jgi:hypothetical protein
MLAYICRCQPLTAQQLVVFEKNMNKSINPTEFLKLFHDTNVKSFARTLIPHSSPPLPNETMVVALQCPRTAALCFDRVWSIPTDETSCPRKVAFNMSTDAELVMALLINLLTRSKNELVKFTDVEYLAQAIVDKDVSKLMARKDLLIPYAAFLLGLNLIGDMESARSSPLNGMTRTIAIDLQTAINRRVFTCYSSELKRNDDYKSGEYQVILGSLHELEVVDEECLSWEQVLEFRRDSAMRSDYRRLVHWLDSQMIGKSNQFVIDEIGVRLDNYKAALRKHGLETRKGVLASMVDSKALLSSLAALGGSLVAGEPIYGGLLAGGVLFGKVLLSVQESKIELENVKDRHNDIAFVAQVSDRFAK